MNFETNIKTETETKASAAMPEYVRYLWAIIFAAVGLLLLFSLLSFSPSDQWLDVHSDNPTFRNWIGPGGAMVSGMLLGYFGFWGVVFPFVFFGFFVTTMWPESLKLEP